MTIHVAVYVVAIVMGKEHDMPPSFKFVAVWIMFCNSFVNSLFYLFLFRNVRTKAMNMFKNAGICCELP